ncbi:MAG: L-seryl-tRNA(Sec) selenium transferase [Blautia sp.]
MDDPKRMRQIPKMDQLMAQETGRQLARAYGYQETLQAARIAADQIRQDPGKDPGDIFKEIRAILKKQKRRHLTHVINGTGVILHTNLGRAPFGEETAEHVARLMTGYTNLELDLETGKRGSRLASFQQDLESLTGAEAVAVVNNNAAAVLLMLTVLAFKRQVCVSRGELVEIGGKFRIPEVMEQSGGILVEVGTTNRTYIEDYTGAVTENTAAFLKVHTSNYQITGFTCAPSVKELAEEAHKRQLYLLVDLGSGDLGYIPGTDPKETVRSVLAQGADLVSFSGDKLLGGPQAGILAGKRELIHRIKKHPLMRALRIDKFTAAVLDETVRLYKESEKQKIPVLEMTSRSLEQMEQMADALLKSLEHEAGDHVQLQMIDTLGTTGGGSMPGKDLPGKGLSIRSSRYSVMEIEERLRHSEPPVIGKIEKDQVVLDMRTIFPGEMKELTQIIKKVLDI